MKEQRQGLDRTDEVILDMLRMNARATTRSIAAKVAMTPSAVQRRIKRLEDMGVIAYYTIGIDHDQVRSTITAYIELRIGSTADVHETLQDLIDDRPEIVREAMTVSGNTDALVRVRVKDLTELREVVSYVRRKCQATDSTTLIVLGHHWSSATAAGSSAAPKTGD